MKVIVTGSFNPITKGHEDIVLRAAEKFDEVIVAVFNNAEKKYDFTLEEREELCKKTFEDIKNIRVVSSAGMVVDLCRRENCFSILRGIRNGQDIDYEIYMRDANNSFDSRCETFFLPARKELICCSSSAVRKLIAEEKDFSPLVPEKTVPTLYGILKRRGIYNEK